MKFAIVFQKDQISQHYGLSDGFKMYDLDDNNQIISSKTILNSGIKGCEMAQLFAAYEISTVIVREIGENAKKNLEEQDIHVIMGASGNLSEIIDDFCHKSLKLNNTTPHRNDHHHCR